MNTYLRTNIDPILQAQAAHPGHTIRSVTQLKLAIFCQKFAYEHSDIFKKKWNGDDRDKKEEEEEEEDDDESSGAARADGR